MAFVLPLSLQKYDLMHDLFIGISNSYATLFKMASDAFLHLYLYGNMHMHTFKNCQQKTHKNWCKRQVFSPFHNLSQIKHLWHHHMVYRFSNWEKCVGVKEQFGKA